jgi:hypothetical protein
MHCVLIAINRFLLKHRFELAWYAACLVFDSAADAVSKTTDEAAGTCWRSPYPSATSPLTGFRSKTTVLSHTSTL